MVQAFSLDGVTEQLKKAYKLFTEGRFTNALQGFNQVLWTIPMVVVDSRQEVDEVKELITIGRSVQSFRCFAATPFASAAEATALGCWPSPL